jgi:iron complex transport system substrate-binding protein
MKSKAKAGLPSSFGNLRIASLLPSATEIVGRLGLQEYLVAISHDCDLCPDEDGLKRALQRGVKRVTVCSSGKISPDADQGAMDAAVRAGLSDQAGSLYSILEESLRGLKPTVLLTQGLCGVCAPSAAQVTEACTSIPGMRLVDLQPHCVENVAETFATIGAACGVSESGLKLKDSFLRELASIKAAVSHATPSPRPSLVLLEWLDPPFDAGHWVPELIDAAGCTPALNAEPGSMSRTRSWEEVELADPDIICVACCGFGLQRNVKDAKKNIFSHPIARRMRAVREGRVFALDGNRHFARPGPSLTSGAAALALIACDNDSAVVARLKHLAPEEGVGWCRLVNRGGGAVEIDIEDIPAVDNCPWLSVHEQACERGEKFYTDPASGLMVMTRINHERRGKCCGSGCRHCPFNHANVPEGRRASCMQQPAYLHRRRSPDFPGGNRWLRDGSRREVHFWSGGKDSFLALRKRIRAHLDEDQEEEQILSRVLLLTTFDAATRIVAHQEIPIEDVQRQAVSLNLDLLGVPLHPGVDYVDRIAESLMGIRVDCLVFGDLHLAHIYHRRTKEWSRVCENFVFPLWQAPYKDLHDDLERSGVSCRITAVEVEGKGGIYLGSLFTRALSLSAEKSLMDAFGERGEFHTLAEVWGSSQRKALGLDVQ